MTSKKQKFIMLHETEKFSMTELCKHFANSRVTGYRIDDAYKTHGEEAFNRLSKSHNFHPFSMPPEIASAILKVRNKYPKGALEN